MHLLCSENTQNYWTGCGSVLTLMTSKFRILLRSSSSSTTSASFHRFRYSNFIINVCFRLYDIDYPCFLSKTDLKAHQACLQGYDNTFLYGIVFRFDWVLV